MCFIISSIYKNKIDKKSNFNATLRKITLNRAYFFFKWVHKNRNRCSFEIFFSRYWALKRIYFYRSLKNSRFRNFEKQRVKNSFLFFSFFFNLWMCAEQHSNAMTDNEFASRTLNLSDSLSSGYTRTLRRYTYQLINIQYTLYYCYLKCLTWSLTCLNTWVYCLHSLVINKLL